MRENNKYKIIDLSIEINDVIFPGNSEVLIEGPFNRIEGNNPEYVYDISMCSQSGTHIQGGHYFKSDGKKIDKYKIDDFEGDAYILDCIEVKDDLTLEVAKVKLDQVDLEDKILVIHTDFMSQFMEYQKSDIKRIGISMDVAKYLCNEKKVKMIAIDSFGIESRFSKHYEVNKFLSDNGILILECISNLEVIKSKWFHLEAFPLKIKGIEGTPCRAIAKVNI